MNKYQGIDYGSGLSNIDNLTGIRYGAIHANSLAECGNDIWVEGAVYLPFCPKCGFELEANEVPDLCPYCQYEIEDESECYGEEPSYIDYMDAGNGIRVEGGLDGDYIVVKSNYYTFAPYCSPCVPGAGDLDSADGTFGIKCYCLPGDYFDSYDPCPYPVWEVLTDKLVSTGVLMEATTCNMPQCDNPPIADGEYLEELCESCKAQVLSDDRAIGQAERGI